MINVLTIDLTQFDKLKDRLTNMSKELAEGVDSVLDANAQDIATKAKTLAPVDMGGMRAQIAADNNKYLEKHVTVNAFYAAFTEFGSGAYAAAYVSSLPPTWQEYASSFRGQKGGGTFAEMLINIEKWVKRKGIGATFSTGIVHRGRKSGGYYSINPLKKGRKERQSKNEVKSIAYAIAVSILKNGIKPQPFLFPSYEQQRPLLIKDVENVLKHLGK